MPFSTIDKSSDYFRVKLYTGNGSTQSITFDESKAMQPDLTWIKVRNDANVTLVHDVIRGATKEIYTPLTNAEATDANGLTAFNSNGFSVGSAFGVNRSGYNFVNWSWKANGTGVSNTAGTISSTVSANTTSGFSIVNIPIGSATGTQTFGHGLGVAPKFIIYKVRGTTDNWSCYHASLGATKHIELNLTNASATSSAWFANTEPTSTVATISCAGGNWFYANQSYIAYCFAEVKGFSKFGSYTGNGSTDGTFVYTGFTPAFVMIKRTDSTADWALCDSKRNPYNKVTGILFPNTSSAEATADIFEFFSNGFKLNQTGGGANASGASYIYMCFASNPFVSSKGIPTTAR